MAVSIWFDYNAYMTNKLAQVKAADPAGNWTMDKVAQAFANSGFTGIEGAEAHFMAFGQNEDVAPNAFFNPTEYYRAKAAQAYGKDYKAVTDADAALVKAAIKGIGQNAWEHYNAFGSNEKVNPSNQFDTNTYMTAKMNALNAIKDGKQYTLDEVYAAFKASGISALEHFMQFGGNGAAGEVTQKYDPKNPAIPAEFAVPEDKKVNAGGESEGTTFTLTTGVDAFVGSANDDTFVAGIVDGADTLTAGDNLDGGAGRDTLKVFGNQGFTGVTTKGIEKFEINGTVFSGSGSFVTLNAAQYQGLDSVNLVNTSSATSVLALTGLADKFTVGVQGTLTANASTFATAAYADTATVANIVATDLATTGYIKAGGKGLTTVNISGNTVGESTIFGFEDNSATDTVKTVNINSTGGKFFLNDSTKVNKVDASASTGDVVISLAGINVAGGSDMAILGGKGDDTFLLNNGLLSNKLSIDGGEGDNTLHVTYVAAGSNVVGGTGGPALGYDVLNAAKNISTIEFNVNGGPLVADPSDHTALLIDMSQLDVTNINLHDSATVSKIAAADHVFAVGADAGLNRTVKLSGETGTSTINLTVDGKGKAITIQEGSAFGSLNVDGYADVNYDNASGDFSVTFNASKLEGKLTYTGGDKAEVVSTGAGGSVIAGTKGFDSYTLGSGADKFAMIAAGTDGVDIDTITGFQAGKDKLMEAGGSASVLAASEFHTKTATGNSVNSTDELDGLLTDLAAACGTTVANNGYLVTLTGGVNAGAYFVFDTGGATVTATDQIVKLVGTEGTITAGDILYTV